MHISAICQIFKCEKLVDILAHTDLLIFNYAQLNKISFIFSYSLHFFHPVHKKREKHEVVKQEVQSNTFSDQNQIQYMDLQFYCSASSQQTSADMLMSLKQTTGDKDKPQWLLMQRPISPSNNQQPLTSQSGNPHFSQMTSGCVMYNVSAVEQCVHDVT